MKSALIALCLILSQTAFAQRQLTVEENLKAATATIASALFLAGLTNFTTEEVQTLLVSVFQNHASMHEHAAAAKCPKFYSAEDIDKLAEAGGAADPGSCYCTDSAAVFDTWLAPVFTATTGADPAELFQTRTGVINGYPLELRMDRAGTVNRGWFKAALKNKLKFRAFVNKTEHGQTGRQMFCDFHGRFRLYTSTIASSGNFIGVNIMSVRDALVRGPNLSLGQVKIQNGEISL